MDELLDRKMGGCEKWFGGANSASPHYIGKSGTRITRPSDSTIILYSILLLIQAIPHRLREFLRMIWLLQEIDAIDQRWPFANDVCTISAGIDDFQLRLLAL